MPGVLRLATDAGLTTNVIRSAFRRTGQFPLNHSVIDRSQLVSDHVTVCSGEDLDPTDGGRRSPAVACWASDHWVASSYPLRGKFRH